MTHHRARALTTLALLATLGAMPLDAQRPQVRQGFWANLGLGVSSLGCDDCGDRETGTAVAIALGGTLNQKWQLGGGIHGWTKTEDGVTLTVGLASALTKFYPSATGGFHLIGGLGIASIDLSVGNVSGTERGWGMLLGLGYDIRVGRNVSLSPFWNGVATWYDDGDLNFGQLGLGVTVH